MAPADALGWAATAVFVASYLCTRPRVVTGVQLCGAAIWIGYGLLISATPVVTANLLVAAAAALALRRMPRDTS
jgi:hypothetical protein